MTVLSGIKKPILSTEAPVDSPARRFLSFIIVLSIVVGLVYGVLPWLTRSLPITRKMAATIEATGIDPSRYYYTDVEQVAESERYVRQALSVNEE